MLDIKARKKLLEREYVHFQTIMLHATVKRTGHGWKLYSYIVITGNE